MRKILTILILFFFMGNLFAQSLTPDVVSYLRNSFQNTQSDVAIRNAVSNSNINDVAYNLDVANKQNHFFSIEVKSGSITNQNSSGRCWMFTSYNVFRPVVMAKFNIPDFEFSENYLYFWDLLEKSNTFLQRIITTANDDIYSREVYSLFSSPVGDGGAWNSFSNLIVKYGAVPHEIMPETFQSNNTGTLIRLLNEKLREDALIIRDMVKNNSADNLIQSKKMEMLKDVYRILVLSLGEPPSEFQWRYKDKDGVISDFKNYTPQSFWQDAVNANLDDYIMFIDDPNQPYYKLYVKQNDRNVNEGIDWTFVNIPTNDLKQFAIASLKGGDIMYFSCDVGKQLSKQNGTLDLNNYDYQSLFGVDFGMTRAQRMVAHQSGSTHGMALCGVDLDPASNPTQWKLENSWGATYGNNGFLTMTNDWFDQYFFRLVINKKYVNQKVLNVLSQTPNEIPFFYPAFCQDL
ncbi:MAG: C1 family peptidase [Bacteroidales bacterium]|nr:C1 family peptidase [Bacteroidales bacterium]